MPRPQKHAAPPPVKRAPRRRYLLPDHFVHTSARTLRGRYAFVPVDEDFTRRAWGLVGRAARRYGVDVAAFVLLSNHFHALLRAGCGAAISAFMQYVKAGLARLTHEYHGTSGPVWDGPYRASNLLDDEAEMSWLRYIVEHGVKEGATPSPRQWPGPHCAATLYDGAPIDAVWLDRVAWRKAGGGPKGPHLRPVELELVPLTAYSGRPDEWRQTCRRLIDDVVTDHAAREFLGVDHVRAVSPHHVPESVKRSRCACFDARGAEARELLSEAYEGRRNAVPAAVAALELLARRGVESEEAELPAQCQWTPLIGDALDERPIVADFMAPEGPPDDAAAA